MKIRYGLTSMLLIPEDARDWNYVQSVLGLRESGDSCEVMLQPPHPGDDETAAGALRISATEEPPMLRRYSLNWRSSLDELELSVRAANALHYANVKTIYELVGLGVEGFLLLKNIANKTLKEVQKVLEEAGFPFGTELPVDLAADVKARRMGTGYRS